MKFNGFNNSVFFRGLTEEVTRLNNAAKTVANYERAKKLRKRLLAVGLPMAILGGAGAIACFSLFIYAITQVGVGFELHELMIKVFVPFCMIIPCSFLTSLGSMIASLGFKILITGYTTELIDEAIGNNCPNCGDVIDEDEFFCNKCGHQLKKECNQCGTINSFKNQFCKKCGTEL